MEVVQVSLDICFSSETEVSNGTKSEVQLKLRNEKTSRTEFRIIYAHLQNKL